MSSSTLFLFFKVVLAILGPLNFHMNIGISLSISVMKSAEILTEIMLTVDQIPEYCHLNSIKTSEQLT